MNNDPSGIGRIFKLFKKGSNELLKLNFAIYFIYGTQYLLSKIKLNSNSISILLFERMK